MIQKGKLHTDERGTIGFNNEFDASQVKRIYTIENHSTEFIRGWQGHKLEQRWFASMAGRFRITVLKVDNFEKPSVDIEKQIFELSSESLDFLHVPAGCLTAIQALDEKAKLLVMADYLLGELKDEYRFPIDYFSN